MKNSVYELLTLKAHTPLSLHGNEFAAYAAAEQELVSSVSSVDAYKAFRREQKPLSVG